MNIDTEQGAWIAFLGTLILAVINNLPGLFSYFRDKTKVEAEAERAKSGAASDRISAVADAAAAVSKSYQELLPTMRSRIKDLESALSDVRKRLKEVEEAFLIVQKDYELSLEKVSVLESDLESWKIAAGNAAEKVNGLEKKLISHEKAHISSMKVIDSLQVGVSMLRKQIFELGKNPVYDPDENP